MAIRPVDMQVVMPRAVEASRTNANENVRPQVEHQQFAEQVQKNVSAERQSVVQTNRTEGASVDKDGKGNGGGYSGRRRGRGGPKDEKEPGRTKEKKSLLDISL